MAQLRVEAASVVYSGQNGPVKALDSLGYRQALGVLRDSWTVAEAVAAAQQGHRNFAKRQLTWFRREPEVTWVEGFGDAAETLRAAMELVQSGLREPAPHHGSRPDRWEMGPERTHLD